MGTAAIRFRIMPEGPDVDLEALEGSAREVVVANGGQLEVVEVKPFAFGLKAMEMVVTVDDKGAGSPDAIEEAIGRIEGVQTCEVVEVGLL